VGQIGQKKIDEQNKYLYSNNHCFAFFITQINYPCYSDHDYFIRFTYPLLVNQVGMQRCDTQIPKI